MLPIPADIFPAVEPDSAYVVGGSIRDVLLGRPPLDYDLAVRGDPEGFARRMVAGTAGHYVELGKPGVLIYRIVADGIILDIAAIEGASIEEDLRRRDFTINALAYDIATGQLLDCLGARNDLAAGRVRMVSPSVFKKDPVRLLRGYRMASDLDFKIEPETEAVIKDNVHLITRTAGERVRAELYKILENPKSHVHLSRMADCGLLTAIFPELKDLQGCRQNRYHQFDVFEHTLNTYCHLETILSDTRAYEPHDTDPRLWTPEVIPTAALKLAVLLHDIGKPAVRSVDVDGNVHFYGHAKKSADMSKAISRRLKLSRNDADYIEFIIRNHMRPLSLFTASRQNRMTRKAVTRFFMKCGEKTPDLLLHCMADIMGKSNDTNRDKDFIAFAGELIRDYLSSYKPRATDPPLLSGHDLINRFGLRPSPLFKTILNRVEEARLANIIHSKSDAEKWVADFLKQREEQTPRKSDKTSWGFTPA